MLGAIGNTYPTQPPGYMAPVKDLADRMNTYMSGNARPGFDPLFDPNSKAYEAYYNYNPKKWLFRYGVESTVGTQGGFNNLKTALYGPAVATKTSNLPAWVQQAERSFTHSQKLINFADKNLNSTYLQSVHHNPFVNINPTSATGGVVPTSARQTTTALYGAKVLDHDELLALNGHEKARIAQIRKTHGWRAALNEAFHKNRFAHAKDVLTQGGQKSGFQAFKSYVSKTLFHREARWLTEPAKRGEVLASILRPLAAGLVIFDVFKTTKRAYTAAEKSGKSEGQKWWETAKTFVTKGIKSFATWSLGTIAYKGIALALGTAIGLPAVVTSVVSILGAVGVGWAFNNLLNKVVPDPPMVD